MLVLRDEQLILTKQELECLRESLRNLLEESQLRIDRLSDGEWTTSDYRLWSAIQRGRDALDKETGD